MATDNGRGHGRATRENVAREIGRMGYGLVGGALAGDGQLLDFVGAAGR